MHRNYGAFLRILFGWCIIILINLGAKIFRTYSHYEKLSFVSLSYMQKASFAWINNFSFSPKWQRKMFRFSHLTTSFLLHLVNFHGSIINFSGSNNRFETWTAIMKIFSSAIESKFLWSRGVKDEVSQTRENAFFDPLNVTIVWLMSMIVNLSELYFYSQLWYVFPKQSQSRCQIKEPAWQTRGKWNRVHINRCNRRWEYLLRFCVRREWRILGMKFRSFWFHFP